MKDFELQHLIRRYIDGTASETERQQLLDWYHNTDHSKVEWSEVEQIDDILARILTNTKQEIGFTDTQPAFSKKRIIWKRISIAASILLTLAMGGLFYYYKFPQTESVYADANIIPGTDKAILKMHDGRTVNLETDTEGKIGSSSFSVSDGQIKLDDQETDSHISPQYTSLETPKGGQYQMILPDGTKVILNAESTIHFSLPFSSTQRKVSIQGEVYFEVAKDTKRPFIVTTHQSQIEVLGTQFNVNAYDKEHIRTTLLEGSIRLNTSKTQLVLIPGQIADIASNDGHISLIKTNIDRELSWTKGYFDFKDEPIEEIMRQLARWYDIEVEYQGDMKGKEYSARILRRDNINDILNKLEATQTIRFKTVGRKVQVISP